jgi:hypothetical protein
MINVTREAAYDGLLAACKDKGTKVKYADRESGTMWLQNRFPFRFYARVHAQYDDTLFEVYDFSPVTVDERYLGTL